MSPQIVEQLSPQPFRQWCAWRLDPKGWELPDSAPVEDDTVRRLAFDLGIGERKLHRWREENASLERVDIEEALHHADVGFWEVYPGVPEPKIHRGGVPSKLGDRQLLELHAAHLAGASIRELGRRIYAKAGYKSPESASVVIRRGFRRLGLRIIPRAPMHIATVRRCGLPTAAGTPCLGIPVIGSDLCWAHLYPEKARESVLRAVEARLAA